MNVSLRDDNTAPAMAPVPVENLVPQVNHVPILDKTEQPQESNFRFDALIISVLVIIILGFIGYFVHQQVRNRRQKVPTEDPEDIEGDNTSHVVGEKIEVE